MTTVCLYVGETKKQKRAGFLSSFVVVFFFFFFSNGLSEKRVFFLREV
jgi:hypothetical protein